MLARAQAYPDRRVCSVSTPSQGLLLNAFLIILLKQSLLWLAFQQKRGKAYSRAGSWPMMASCRASHPEEAFSSHAGGALQTPQAPAALKRPEH